MKTAKYLTRRIMVAAVLALVLPFGLAHAVCPSIIGDWAVTYEESYQGDTAAGVGIISFSATRGVYAGFETYLGSCTKATSNGKYQVSNSCRIRWKWKSPTFGTQGVVHGVIVNSNKLYLIYSNPVWEESGRAVAERIQ